VCWHRDEGRFVPGAGESAGYVLLSDDESTSPVEEGFAAIDAGALWESP
jgi:hypothetical protein